jgi:transcriptional regulator with XRE-family HTH domain
MHPATQPIVPEMTDTTTLGSYLRRERERRGLTLRVISENTKVSFALLEGLEADDISRWPGGIFRRAFVRSYAQCVGLDPDDVFRRFEEQFRPVEPEPAGPGNLPLVQIAQAAAIAQNTSTSTTLVRAVPGRSRVIGTAADLTVALVLAFGSAAAGSRLLWPVLLIAAYYAAGILLTGTSPMVALLSDQPSRPPLPERSREPAQSEARAQSLEARRAGDAPLSHRRGMQAGVS